MAQGTRKIGDFCWMNMLTPEPEKARAFFAELLGWTYGEMPGLGHGVRVGGHDVGALFDVKSERTPEGSEPQIGVVLKVASADATVAKVNAEGGKAEPAFDVMDAGRLAVCRDPDGAEFDVWEPKNEHGSEVDGAEHGAPSWFELFAKDHERSASFYAAVFGWQPGVMPMPELTYTIFKLGEDYVGGMLGITPAMGELAPHWATYFTVRDVEATARRAVELGAELFFAPKDVPNVGRFCGIRSPQGVPFYAMQYAR